jgi:hypothetical protein
MSQIVCELHKLFGMFIMYLFNKIGHVIVEK